MTTIDIDEATRNAILAALDERAAKLGVEIERLQTRPREEFDERPCPACGAALSPADTHFDLFDGVAGGYVCPDWQRALVWNIAALHETNMARLLVGEGGGETLAESVAWVKAEPWTDEQRAAAGGYHEWQSGR